MRPKLPSFLATVALMALATFNSHVSRAEAQETLATAFTYQGELNTSGSPVTGLCDLQFSLYNAASGGSQIGSPVTNLAVGVTNGLFTTTLNFGAVLAGNPTWLAISVRTNGAAGFSSVAPFQELTPTPYAIYSATAGNALAAGSVSAGNIVGPLTVGQLPTGVLTNGASGVDVTGTFTGNGGGLTNVPLASLTSGFFQGWGGFTLASSPATGLFPLCVVTADVNGDGQPDMIVVNEGGLVVLTNNGSGGFVLAETLPVGFPDSVVSADVNGDGKPDLISTGSGGLTVYTNNGSGGFVLAATITTTISPYSYQSLAVADLFGTGKPNLIVANRNASTFSVFANNGGGNFSLASTVTESTDPSADLQNVLVADVNGDGKPDLICATYFEPPAVTVMTNNGSGGFVISGTYSVSGITALAVADVNGDGTLDIVCASGGGLTVLTNNGSGGFAQSTTLGSGGAFTAVCTNDVNGDGKVDLIAANENGWGENGTLSVFTNNGTGGFALAATPAVGDYPVNVVATDVNGDGRVDLIAVNYVDDTLSVLLNGPIYTGTFAGNGSGLTQLDATNLTGTVPDADLPGDVALLGAAQTFESLNTFTDPYNQFTGNFTGNGGGLTNLNAPSLTGAVPASSLTSVPAGSLTGTIPQASLGTSGAWSPTIGDGAHPFTLSSQSGYYARQGNLVYFEITVGWSGKGSAVAGDALQISLPYAVASSRAAFTPGFVSGLTFGNQVTAGSSSGSAYLVLYTNSNSGGAPSALPVSSCSTSGLMAISGWYRWQ